MEIPQKGSPPSLPATSTHTDRQSPSTADVALAPDNSPGRPTPGDTVNFSDRGRELRSAMQQAQSAPDLREDRIMHLREQIANGNYRVNGGRVAGHLIEETEENNAVMKQIDINA